MAGEQTTAAGNNSTAPRPASAWALAFAAEQAGRWRRGEPSPERDELGARLGRLCLDLLHDRGGAAHYLAESAQQGREAAGLKRILLGALDGGSAGDEDGEPAAAVLAWEQAAAKLRDSGDSAALEQHYIKAAERALARGMPELSVSYSTAAGLLAFDREELDSAERQLNGALELAPGDSLALAAQVLVYRRAGRWRQLVASLNRQLAGQKEDAARVRLHTEIGRVALEQLDDLALAERHLELAMSLQPQAAGAAILLGRLADARLDHARAVSARQQAVSGHLSGGSAVLLHCEIAVRQADQLADQEGAEAAWLQALAIDAGFRPALDGLSALYQRQGRHGERAALLEQRLALEGRRGGAAALHLELGDVAERHLRYPARALTHYREALALEPDSALALDGLGRVARRLGQWEVLVEALEGEAADPLARELLLEALEQLGRWEQLEGLLRHALEEARNAADEGDLARRLAELIQTRKHDSAEALGMARRALAAGPNDPELLTWFCRFADELGELESRIDARQRLLEALPASHGLRNEIVAELVDLLVEADRAEVAIALLEEVLQYGRTEGELLDRLAKLYRRERRPQEQLELLQERAARASDRAEQVTALLAAGRLQEERGDADAALVTLLEAFSLDPARRETFTHVERLCYRLKRWKDVMAVYGQAIELVASGGKRAYRLEELYSRRGQLQLQYLGQPGEAAASYVKVLELEPDNESALRFLESIYAEEQDWDGLQQAYEHQIARLEDIPDQRIEIQRRAGRVAASKQKDMAAAAGHYVAVLEHVGQDAEALEALERCYERLGRWEALTSLLQQRLSEAEGRRDQAALLVRIGTIEEDGQRDVAAAVTSYRKALELDEQQRDALTALARIYESTARWEDYLKVTRQQIRLTRDRSARALLYFKCGSVMEAQFERPRDAIRYYQRAIQTSSTCLPAVHGLRDIYLHQQDWRRVIRTLKLEARIWQESRERSGVLARIGRICSEQLDDLPRAQRYWQAALEVDERCQTAIRSLFELAFAEQDWEQAAELSGRLNSRSLREGDPAVRSRLAHRRAVVSLNMGEAAQAAENLMSALELRPENLAALDDLIALCRSQPGSHDFLEAFDRLERSYRRREVPAARSRVLVARGALLEQAGDYDGALDCLYASRSLAPRDYRLVEPLVDALVCVGDAGGALKELASFLAQGDLTEPVLLEVALRRVALLSEVKGDSEAAVEGLMAVTEANPDHCEARFSLARELFAGGRFAEARDVCEGLVELARQGAANPEELGVYEHFLSVVAREQGDTANADTALIRAVEHAPVYPPAVLARAARLGADGAWSKALALVGKARRRARELDEVERGHRLQRGLADLRLAMDDPAGATEELEALVQAGVARIDDRLVLARLHASHRDGRGGEAAREQLHHVVTAVPEHDGALRLLADLARPALPAERRRPLEVLGLLGMASGEEQAQVDALGELAAGPAGVLDEGLRARFLGEQAWRGPFGQLWVALRGALERLYPARNAPADVRAYSVSRRGVDPAELARRIGLGRLPVGMLVSAEVEAPCWRLAGAGHALVLPQALLRGPPTELEFLLARWLESWRAGYALLDWITPRQRREVAELLRALLRPPESYEPALRDFLGLLERPQLRAVDRVAEAAKELALELRPEDWYLAVEQSLREVALVVADDLGAACRSLAHSQALEAALLPNHRVVIRALPGGQNLLRFYLSRDYYALQATLVPAPR